MGQLKPLGQRASTHADSNQPPLSSCTHATGSLLRSLLSSCGRRGHISNILVLLLLYSATPRRHRSRDFDDVYDDRPPRRRRTRVDDLDLDAEPIQSGWDASGWFSGAQQANQGGFFDWARGCACCCCLAGGS